MPLPPAPLTRLRASVTCDDPVTWRPCEAVPTTANPRTVTHRTPERTKPLARPVRVAPGSAGEEGRGGPPGAGVGAGGAARVEGVGGARRSGANAGRARRHHRQRRQ